jgi:phosphoribosylformylglycinamidine synthase PurS subunit
MKFVAEIDVMPLKALLDPQGKAVKQSMQKIGYTSVSNVRIGKHFSLEFEAKSKDEAEILVKDACKKMLINPIMENFEFTINKA